MSIVLHKAPVGSSLMYGIPGALGDMFYSPINQIGRYVWYLIQVFLQEKELEIKKIIYLSTDRPDQNLSDEEVQHN